MLNTFLQYFCYGFLQHMPWWGYVIALLSMTYLTVLSTTVYLHRCMAHRALELHPIASHFFRFWLWLSTSTITKEWTAIHRKHHAKVETGEDPHSPVAQGITKVLFEGAELYRLEAKKTETLDRYGEGTPDDWLERHIYTRRSIYGVASMLLIDMFLFGMVGVTIWAIQMAWIPFFAAGVINGIGHYFGYRNFESRDASRNVVPFGFLLGGEELHNNHHAFATSAKFSAKWWEIDSGWAVIKMLSWFGLAKAKRILPTPVTQPSKTVVDTDTLQALITYRFQVMSRYTREVVMPALRDERKRAGKAGKALLSRAKVALVRDEFIMQAKQKTLREKVLANFQSLRMVYQFRVNLQNIWSRSTTNQKELLEALQEWCVQAEATGSDALLRFAKHLKTYVPQKVKVKA